jgi:hypothetical protein
MTTFKDLVSTVVARQISFMTRVLMMTPTPFLLERLQIKDGVETLAACWLPREAQAAGGVVAAAVGNPQATLTTMSSQSFFP